MDQVRETAESLLKQSGIQITRDGDILPFDAIISASVYNSSEEEEEEHMSEVSQNRVMLISNAYS